MLFIVGSQLRVCVRALYAPLPAMGCMRYIWGTHSCVLLPVCVCVHNFVCFLVQCSPIDFCHMRRKSQSQSQDETMNVWVCVYVWHPESAAVIHIVIALSSSCIGKQIEHSIHCGLCNMCFHFAPVRRRDIQKWFFCHLFLVSCCCHFFFCVCLFYFILHNKFPFQSSAADALFLSYTFARISEYENPRFFIFCFEMLPERERHTTI